MDQLGIGVLMVFGLPLLGLAAITALPPTYAHSSLWNGISTGQERDAVTRQIFVDARGRPHSFLQHSVIGDFYLQRNNRAAVQILYRGKPRIVCGVDIEGARETLEREALLSELGPPNSHSIRELLESPGGSSALLSGGKLFRI